MYVHNTHPGVGFALSHMQLVGGEVQVLPAQGEQLADPETQLFGYTTWQDSRLALIFYVKAKGISGVIESARAEMEERDEFIAWEKGAMEGELRCRVHWPDDPSVRAPIWMRAGRLTSLQGRIRRSFPGE